MVSVSRGRHLMHGELIRVLACLGVLLLPCATVEAAPPLADLLPGGARALGGMDSQTLQAVAELLRAGHSPTLGGFNEAQSISPLAALPLLAQHQQALAMFERLGISPSSGLDQVVFGVVGEDDGEAVLSVVASGRIDAAGVHQTCLSLRGRSIGGPELRHHERRRSRLDGRRQLTRLEAVLRLPAGVLGDAAFDVTTQGEDLIVIQPTDLGLGEGASPLQAALALVPSDASVWSVSGADSLLGSGLTWAMGGQETLEAVALWGASSNALDLSLRVLAADEAAARRLADRMTMVESFARSQSGHAPFSALRDLSMSVEARTVSARLALDAVAAQRLLELARGVPSAVSFPSVRTIDFRRRAGGNSLK